jgi:hypothetical protein
VSDTPVSREEHIRHLEMIQNVIARLANNSFFMKGWGLTVTGAIYGFAATDLNWLVCLVGLLPAFAFWFLDSYYVRQERLFRHLYGEARRMDDRVEPFGLDTRPYLDREPWPGVLFSMTLAPLYGVIIAAGLILAAIAAFKG